MGVYIFQDSFVQLRRMVDHYGDEEEEPTFVMFLKKKRRISYHIMGLGTPSLPERLSPVYTLFNPSSI